MPINRLKKFKDEILFRLQEYKKNPKLKKSATSFFDQIGYDKAKNVYNFFWCGIPIIQLPQDIQTKQELIWEYKPEIIVETGVAWGGSLIFYSTMLGMLEDSVHINNGKVIGVEKNLKPSNKEKDIVFFRSDYVQCATVRICKHNKTIQEEALFDKVQEYVNNRFEIDRPLFVKSVEKLVNQEYIKKIVGDDNITRFEYIP